MTSCLVRSASNPRVTVKSRKSGLRRNRRMERSRPLCSTETADHTFEHDDTSACHAPPAGCRARGVPARARLHGHVRHVRPGRRAREHRDDSCRARRRHHAARHRRLLRRRPQRAAHRPRAAGPPRQAPCSRSSSARCAARTAPGSAWTLRPAAVKNFLGLQPDAARRRPHRHLPARAGSIRRCRSRRPSAPSRIWSRPATCAPSGCPKSARTRSAARTRSTRSADLQIEYSLDQPRPRSEDLPGARGARHRRHRLRRAVARPAERLEASGHRATSGRTCRASRARTSSATRRWSKRCGALAAEQGVTASQLAIAWVLAKGASSSR